MIKKYGSLLALVYIGLMILLVFMPQIAISASGVPVVVNAPEHISKSESSLSVPVSVGTISELNAVQFDITFNHDVLKWQPPSNGVINNTTVSPLVNQITDPSPQTGFTTYRFVISFDLQFVSGSGIFAVLNFQPIGEVGQTGIINITNGILSGKSGEIYATWVSDTVNIAGSKKIQGETREANGNILAGVTLTMNGEILVISDLDGTFEIDATTTGTHTIIASKVGFRDQILTVEVTELSGSSSVEFKGNNALVPKGCTMQYVLSCINKWKYPPHDGTELSLSKALRIINAMKFPID